MPPNSVVAPQSVSLTESEYLAFSLGGEEYGIDILKVQELRGYESVTKIANAPEYIKGVTNLRGQIVPIIDMRIRLNLSLANYDQFTVVIILAIATRVIGIVVDSVCDVVTLQKGDIKPVPQIGSAIDTRYVLGIGTIDQRMLILMDIDRLLSVDAVIDPLPAYEAGIH